MVSRQPQKWEIPVRSAENDDPVPENVTMFEAFEWFTPKDQKHWRRLQDAMPSLKAIGIDNIWIPPGCKAGWHGSNGYDLYDLYDLGEFKQKDSRATKWGTKEELVEMINAANANGMGIYWDAVLNHKAAADYTEKCQVQKVETKNRMKETGKPEEIEAWTGFEFSGRGNKYSSLKYTQEHFSGTDYDAKSNTNGVWKMLGKGKKGWAKDVDDELGNYDYLMFADLDYSHPDVRKDVFRWGEWLGKELSLAGIRFDAIKHYSEEFLKSFIRHLDQTVGPNWFFVGEYWRDDLEVLSDFIRRFDNRLSLFDVPLVSNMERISRARHGDLRDVFKGTLALHKPANAVTFVQNHDTQERASLETIVAEWFKPMGYALILLRASCGYPCVFYGDLYGVQGEKALPPSCGGRLAHLILARKLYAYGHQMDYFDQAHCVGFTRFGHPSHSSNAGLAVVMTNAHTYTHKRMCVGRHHAGERWTDILRWAWGEVVIDQRGWGTFPVGPRSVGVWVDRAADGRESLDGFIFDDDIYKEDQKETKPKRRDEK